MATKVKKTKGFLKGTANKNVMGKTSNQKPIAQADVDAVHASRSLKPIKQVLGGRMGK